MNVKHRTLTVAQFSSGQSIVSEKSKLFPQLTLFPRGCGILVKDVQSLVEPRILPAPQ